MFLAAHAGTPYMGYDVLLYLSLFFGTLIHEGTAIAAGAAFLVAQRSSALLTATVLIAGIVTGDFGVYGLGALTRRSKWLQRRLGVSAPSEAPPLLGAHLISIVAMCRVVPGMLFPVFWSYGWRGVPFVRFAATTVAVTVLYVSVLLTLFVQFGLRLAPMFQHWSTTSLIAIAAIAVAAAAPAGWWLWTRRRRRLSPTA